MAPNSRYPINIPNDGGGKAPPVGNVIENNILYTPDSSHGSVLIATSDPSGFHSDYNVVVGQFSDNDGNTVVNMAKWQSLGYDLHSVVSTPAQLFVNPVAFNYQLKPGSPAVDAGVTLTDVPTDILGVKRPQGVAYDIGCYELLVSVIPIVG
jgi:hypothetical protein